MRSDREIEMLDAMIDAPDDAGLRTVFGDVLLERGEPLGELIQAHAEAEDNAAIASRRDQLRDQLRARIEAAGGVMRHGHSEATGWVWLVEMSAAAFLTNPDVLFTVGPIHHLRLTRTRGLCTRLAACRHLRWVTDFMVMDNDLDAEEIERLVASPHLMKLIGLDLHGHDIKERGAIAIASAPFERLERLDVGFSKLGNEGVIAIAAAPFLPQLKTLALTSNEIDDRALVAVLPRARELEELRLSYNPWLGSSGASAIAEATHLGKLETLSMGDCGLGDTGAAALAGAPHLGAVNWLNFDRNALANPGAQALVNAGTFAADCILSVDDNPSIDDAHLEALWKRFKKM